jgi:hypothetical protein
VGIRGFGGIGYATTGTPHDVLLQLAEELVIDLTEEPCLYLKVCLKKLGTITGRMRENHA